MALFPGALGDFVCFLPTLKKLAARGIVDLRARTAYADLAPPEVRVGSLECHEITRLFVPEAEAEERLTSFFSSYSHIYSWMGGGQSHFASRLRVVSKGEVEIFPFLPGGPQGHMVDYYLSCIGVKHPGKLCPTVRLTPDALAWCRGFWQCHGLEKNQVLTLAPGSGAREKNWPVVFYAAVARWWQRELGGKVVVILGPVEEERAQVDHFFKEAVVVRHLSLAHLAALIHQCDLFVGNDSGVTHLAAALGVEVIALFGPTDPTRWAPRGKRATVISREEECSPCEPIAMKACAHRKCLTALSPKYVIRTMGTVRRHASSVCSNLLDKGGVRDYS